MSRTLGGILFWFCATSCRSSACVHQTAQSKRLLKRLGSVRPVDLDRPAWCCFLLFLWVLLVLCPMLGCKLLMASALLCDHVWRITWTLRLTASTFKIAVNSIVEAAAAGDSALCNRFMHAFADRPILQVNIIFNTGSAAWYLLVAKRNLPAWFRGEVYSPANDTSDTAGSCYYEGRRKRGPHNWVCSSGWRQRRI